MASNDRIPRRVLGSAGLRRWLLAQRPGRRFRRRSGTCCPIAAGPRSACCRPDLGRGRSRCLWDANGVWEHGLPHHYLDLVEEVTDTEEHVKIEAGKTYRTRGDAVVRVICTDADHPEFPVVGFYGYPGIGSGEGVRTFTSAGRDAHGNRDMDLVAETRAVNFNNSGRYPAADERIVVGETYQAVDGGRLRVVAVDRADTLPVVALRRDENGHEVTCCLDDKGRTSIYPHLSINLADGDLLRTSVLEVPEDGSEPGITPGDGWQTRNGRPVRVLCNDAPGPYPVVGYITDGKANTPVQVWDAHGQWSSYGLRPELDLVPVPPKPRSETRYVCLLGYRDRGGTYTRMFARTGAIRSHLMESDRRVLLSVHKIEVTEDEFDVPAEDL